MKENENSELKQTNNVISESSVIPEEKIVPPVSSVMKKSSDELMTLSWRVTAKVKPKKKNVKQKIKGVCQKIKRKKADLSDNKETTILNNGNSIEKIISHFSNYNHNMSLFLCLVTGVVEPGQICAIMGARLDFILLINK